MSRYMVRNLDLLDINAMGRLCERGSWNPDLAPLGHSSISPTTDQKVFRSLCRPILATTRSQQIKLPRSRQIRPTTTQPTPFALIGDIVLLHYRGDLGRRALMSGEYEGLAVRHRVRFFGSGWTMFLWLRLLFSLCRQYRILRWMESRAVGTTNAKLELEDRSWCARSYPGESS